jgi:hypothetical protein
VRNNISAAASRKWHDRADRLGRPSWAGTSLLALALPRTDSNIRKNHFMVFSQLS